MKAQERDCDCEDGMDRIIKTSADGNSRNS